MSVIGTEALKSAFASFIEDGVMRVEYVDSYSDVLNALSIVQRNEEQERIVDEGLTNIRDAVIDHLLHGLRNQGFGDEYTVWDHLKVIDQSLERATRTLDRYQNDLDDHTILSLIKEIQLYITVFTAGGECVR